MSKPAAPTTSAQVRPPLGIDPERVPIYSPAFSAAPHALFEELRARYGSLVPIDLAPGVPATLVIDYRTAVQILHDPNHFPADPRTWQRDIPADCPILPILGYRPNALRSTGYEHSRYRVVNTDSIDAIDLHALHGAVERVAVSLINTFCETGSADLVGQYAFPLAFEIVNVMLGCPPEIGHRIAAATAAILEGVDAEAGNKMLYAAVGELVAHRRAHPGDDITSRVIQHHAALAESEIIEQVLVLYGGGTEPLGNLIAKTMLLLLIDDHIGGPVLGGSMSTRDAVDEVLFNDPPFTNFCISYPRQPILIDGVLLPAHQPIVISLLACNADPVLGSGDRTGNRSHLAWGAGPHSCPARRPAYLVAQDAVDQLLDILPEMRLAIAPDELVWRPGPFHRALSALPVTFPATRPILVD
ncbi:cytochrome P450 [Nocardia sp. NEAU-G5]|uniref:Cytochrome P450 n=1 Tax=Nocardia albiluteola TaxID=2842303 RepID=A0ABS6BCX3_9NOCA|nr:cytochrome P450 [Nocardia albiluteola]MBU3067063.1 cytochrome P450 [Nocardia albiluteola]